MKKISMLGKVLSKAEQKKIVGGLDCPNGYACSIAANSCGPAQIFNDCKCEVAAWECTGDAQNCTTICM